MEALFGSRQCCLNTLVLRHLERGFCRRFCSFFCPLSARERCVSLDQYSRVVRLVSRVFAWLGDVGHLTCRRADGCARILNLYPVICTVFQPPAFFLCVQGCNSSRS